MRSAILRAGSVIFAVTVLAAVVIHAGMSAGCTSEPRVQAEPPRPTTAQPPAEPTANPPTVQPQAAQPEPIVPTAKPQTKAAPPPPPRFMPATKAAPVFRGEDLSQSPQQAPQPPQQQQSKARNGNR